MKEKETKTLKKDELHVAEVLTIVDNGLSKGEKKGSKEG